MDTIQDLLRYILNWRIVLGIKKLFIGEMDGSMKV